MRTPIEGITPFVVALEQIEGDDLVNFIGIDTETGASVRVKIERLPGHRPACVSNLLGKGLLLVLSVERFEPTH